MTICTQCRYLIKTDSAPIWYNYYCGAIPIEGTVDPVTGLPAFPKKNDLGETYYDEVGYPYCRDINKGDCKYFERKKGWLRK